METLKKYIYAIHLIDILKTQKIDSYFAVKYILNKNYQLTKEEESITIETVLHYQPHISKNELTETYFTHYLEDDSHNLSTF